MGQSTMRARQYSLLLLIIVIGVLVRCVGAALTKGHGYDLDIMSDWGYDLKFRRLDEFYHFGKGPNNQDGLADHLPGDIWIHWLLSTIYQSFGGTQYWSDTYWFLLRMVPTLADAMMAWVLFHILGSLVSPRAGLLAAAALILNPTSIFLSSVWGQWDSVSMALLLCGLWVIISHPTRWLWAVPIVAWAAIVKPPIALPGAFLLATPLLLYVRDRTPLVSAILGAVTQAVAAAVIGLVTVVLICIPFSLGLPGMATQWTIFQRAQLALDLYPYKVLSAGNIWMLQEGSFDQIDDRVDTTFGLDSHDLGNLYLGLAVLAVGAMFIYLLWGPFRERAPLALIWAMLGVTYATFMLPTRVHERYLFPAFVLLLMVAAWHVLDRQLWALFGIVSANFLANLAFVYYGLNQDDFIDRYGEGTVTFLLRAVSVVNILAFVIVLAMPYRWLQHERAAKARPTSPSPQREALAP